ncbi:leukocyte immunoglobulin-like receptor subfamily B member 4A [Discoglossus pictus]
MKSIISLTGYLLIMIVHVLSGHLWKPILLVAKEHGEIIMGETVKFQCTNYSTKPEEFFLNLNGTNTSVIMKQDESEFTISNIMQNNSGLYTCHYCYQSACSEPSDAMNIFIRDTFPQPSITVVPRKIIQPGQDITITCSADYSDIVFSFYKNNKLIKEDSNGGKQFSYDIKHATEEDNGQYECNYKTKPGNKVEVYSRFSNPMLIKVKDLQQPSISWEADPKDNGTFRIYCTAPDIYTRMWFQLLKEDKTIEDEIEVVKAKNVTFTIRYTKHKIIKYYCMYRIRIDDSFADSFLSDLIQIGAGNYTTVNIIRLVLAAVIFVSIGFIVYKHFGKSPKDRGTPT